MRHAASNEHKLDRCGDRDGRVHVGALSAFVFDSGTELHACLAGVRRCGCAWTCANAVMLRHHAKHDAGLRTEEETDVFIPDLIICC